MHRLAALFAALALCAGPAIAGSDGQDFAKVQRGRYLTTVGDCSGCHDEPGGAHPLAGGLKIETPFGTVTASNITPDKDTGIGSWTDDQFVRALTHGIRRDGSHLYPAMPYPYYTKATRDDLLAIRAYLATVPGVRHATGGDDLPFPLNIRAGMAVWNKLYFTPGEFRPVDSQGAEWNRGAYLVRGLMHCGACHTPKNLVGADKASAEFQGNEIDGWFAPEIAAGAPRGLANWSADDIVAYLKSGHNKFAAATGPMADVVTRSTSRMKDDDLHAIAVYLKAQHGSGNQSPKPVAASDPAMKMGGAIFGDECAACHTGHGTGRPRLFPSLAGSAAVQSRDPTSLIRVVLGGARSVGTETAPTSPAMPAFGWLFNDEQAAAVLTYIRNSWGNAAPAVDAGQVHDVRKALTQRSG